MKAQVVAINAGEEGYQMQRWHYTESTFLHKSSWCLFSKYTISRVIGFQNITIMSRIRLTAHHHPLPHPRTLPQAGAQATHGDMPQCLAPTVPPAR